MRLIYGEEEVNITTMTSSVTVWPPLDMRGVKQPVPSPKDITVIVFVILLWLYSIFLTARAYKKLLSDGRAEPEIQIVDWWRTLLEMVITRSRGQRQSKHIGDKIPSDPETEAALSTV